jgi:hypothetical protein
MATQHRCCASGCQDFETKIGKAFHGKDHIPLVAVGYRDEDGALGRQRPEPRNLAFGKSGAESDVKAHHLTGRPHFRTKNGIDRDPVNGPEAVERHHRFLDRNGCR